MTIVTVFLIEFRKGSLTRSQVHYIGHLSVISIRQADVFEGSEWTGINHFFVQEGLDVNHSLSRDVCRLLTSNLDRVILAALCCCCLYDTACLGDVHIERRGKWFRLLFVIDLLEGQNYAISCHIHNAARPLTLPVDGASVISRSEHTSLEVPNRCIDINRGRCSATLV